MLPMKSEKRSATGAAIAPPLPATIPVQTRIAAGTPRRIAGGTGRGAANKRYAIARSAGVSARRYGTSCTIAPPTTASAKRTLPDDGEGVVGAIERANGTVVIDDRDVFDAHTEATRQVDTGFDRERHARLEPLAVPANEVRMLVPVEADPVPRPVDEELPVPRLLDDRSRGRIHRFRGRPFFRGGVARLLRATHDLVDA